MELEQKLQDEVKNAEKEMNDLEIKFRGKLITEEQYKISKADLEKKINELKDRLLYIDRAKNKVSDKVKKIDGDLTSIIEFDLQKEMEFLLNYYQIELEESVITIFITVSVNRTEKIFLSIKDKYHPVLKLNKNLLYLGDPFDYLESLKMWRQGKPVHIVEIIREFEQYLLKILGMNAQSNFDLNIERTHILNRAREYLNNKMFGQASYLYDYAAELSSRLGEEKVAVAYRNKVHKLQLQAKGEFIL